MRRAILATALSVSLSATLHGETLSPADQALVDRCKETILNARGVPEAQRQDERFLDALGVSQPLVDCEQGLPKMVRGQIRDFGLVISEPACDGCLMHIEVYCKAHPTSDIAGLRVGYQEPDKPIPQASYAWIIKPWIGQRTAVPVAVDPGEIYVRSQKGEFECYATLNRPKS